MSLTFFLIVSDIRCLRKELDKLINLISRAQTFHGSPLSALDKRTVSEKERRFALSWVDRALPSGNLPSHG